MNETPLRSCELAAARVAGDARRGLDALIPPTKDQAVRDYARERALIDAKELLKGLDEVSIENLGFGRLTARAIRFASQRTRVRIIDAEYNDDAFLADTLTDLLKAGKLLMEARYGK